MTSYVTKNNMKPIVTQTTLDALLWRSESPGPFARLIEGRPDLREQILTALEVRKGASAARAAVEAMR